jgi:phage shock protein E
MAHDLRAGSDGRGNENRLNTMKWTTILIIAAVVVVILLLKKAGQIPVKDAREYLKKGALVIDVRSPGEFNSGHLSPAINIPLDEIGVALPRRVQDKDQVLLLHCQSGMRSGIAAKKLKGMGYTNTFNLGSLARARSIIDGAEGQ